MQRFRAARADGDANAAMRAAHNLKCEAATLGMHDLHEAAADLERACVQGARDSSVEDILHRVSTRLDVVIDELRTRADTPAP